MPADCDSDQAESEPFRLEWRNRFIRLTYPPATQNIRGNMAHHIFACPQCNAPMEVATQHAGQSRECPQCHAMVEIPKLGVLKQLPTTEETPTRKQSRRQGSLRSWLFSGGLLVAALMGVGGLALQTYARTLYSDVGKFKRNFEATTTDSIDAMKDYEVLEWWTEMNTRGLGEWKEHPGIGYNVQSKILTWIAYGMYGLGGLGLLCLVSSFMLGRPD